VLFAVVGFALVDFAAGAMQLPSRALMMDVTPTHQQTQGSALFSFWMSAGNALGYLFASVDWSQWQFFDTIYTSASCFGTCVNYRALFVYATIMDVVTVFITLISVREIVVSLFRLTAFQNDELC
jgi:MFS family permease